MNIDLLKKRLEQLENQLTQKQNIIDQTISDINAISGAIQEVNYWVDQIEKSNIEN